MPPIFKNCDISREDIGAPMREYAEAHNIMSQPRRSLIGSYKGEGILLATPLLRWYVDHGLVVDKIHQVVQYWPQKCFQRFGQDVSDARRAGDADPNKAIVADTMKLLGNSAYGKCLCNKSRHRDIKYCTDDDASDCVNDPHFRSLHQLDDNLYEVELSKKTIRLDLPLHIGYFVYQYAKLRMLQFHFDYLVKYVDDRDFALCEMDTDSEYMALSKPNLEEVVKPELRQEFFDVWPQWLPAQSCDFHHQDFVQAKTAGEPWEPKEPCCVDRKKYDRRTPGLFKVEWEGDGIIGLCSKTYYCFGPKDKLSCKGLNKTQNDLTKDVYMNVLNTKENGSGTNIGFQVKNNAIYTYAQTRAGLSYFYPKRIVATDGVSTTPLAL